jgi:AraC family transcriptional regulator
MLVGLHLRMSLNNNRTADLWKSFMQRRNEIPNAMGSDLFSMQIYNQHYFDSFSPNNDFEKWAAIEVSDFNNIPAGFDSFSLPAGKYAVFHYKGEASKGVEVFGYIFGTWLPQSDFELDNRPHFELLGTKYSNHSPDSEEEIWIPVKKKNS